MTLLVVDDDTLQMRLMNRMLSFAGYVVKNCETIADVTEQVLRAPGHFQLVISDLEMPEGTGLQLAHRLGGIVGAPPVLLCTGCRRLPRFAEPMVRGVLHKPFKREQLLERVSAIIGNK